MVVSNSGSTDSHIFHILASSLLEGQFVPLPALGNILDNLTFALNSNKMAHKNMKEKDKNSVENNTDMDINTDENQSGVTHLNEPVVNDPELEKIKAELEEMKDKYLRAVAEFDNFKRRNAKERMELIQTAGREVIIDLLDVLDDCDRAQKQMENSNDVKEIREGVLLVFNKLRNILQARGLKAMKTIKEEFNPDLHEAVTEITVPSEEQKGKIADEIAKGYYLNDKIIRHAKVVVGK
jgi:molecular chaperone GrpE